MIALLHSYLDHAAYRDRELMEAAGHAVAMVAVNPGTLRTDTAHALHFRTLVIPTDKTKHTTCMQSVVDIAVKVGVRVMRVDEVLNTTPTGARTKALTAAPPSAGAKAPVGTETLAQA